jgi:hypothetical protein
MKSLYGSHGIQGMYPWIHVPSEIKGNLIHAQTCVAKFVALNCLSFVSPSTCLLSLLKLSDWIFKRLKPLSHGGPCTATFVADLKMGYPMSCLFMLMITHGILGNTNPFVHHFSIIVPSCFHHFPIIFSIHLSIISPSFHQMRA